MEKLKNKSGFTLVELMIVVVILGVLVAIAVPIYSVNVSRSQEKACRSNMAIIKKAATQYLMTYDGAELKDIFADGTSESVTVASEQEAKEKFTPEYLSMLDGGRMPIPEDDVYTVRLNGEKTALIVTCSNENHN